MNSLFFLIVFGVASTSSWGQGLGSKFIQNIASGWVEALSGKTCPEGLSFSKEDFAKTAENIFLESTWDLSDSTLTSQVQKLVNDRPSFACKRTKAELDLIAREFLNLKKAFLAKNISVGGGLIPALAVRADLLQYLAEETLFVLSQNQKGRFEHFWSNTKYLSGDVLISKGGAGSSAFLTRLGDRPAFYSHAAVLWRSFDDNKFYLPEAFIEDGVKLRDANQDYFPTAESKNQAGKRRLSVFRLLPEVPELGDWHYHVEKFSLEVLEKPLPYDFASDVKDHSRFTCLEVPMYLAKNAKISSPYPEAGWQKLTPVQKKFFESLDSQIVETLPVPQGLETAGQPWNWVGFSIDLDQLLIDRVDGLVIDYFWQYLANPKNSPTLKNILKKFEKISSDEKVKSGLMLAAKKEGIQIPEGMNIKEALFFGLLDKIVVVEIRKMVLDAHPGFVQEFGRPMTLNDLEFFIRLNIQTHFNKWKLLFD